MDRRRPHEAFLAPLGVSAATSCRPEGVEPETDVPPGSSIRQRRGRSFHRIGRRVHGFLHAHGLCSGRASGLSRAISSTAQGRKAVRTRNGRCRSSAGR